MTMREKMARAMCAAAKTDPDHICYGLGDLMPEGASYPAWHYQAVILDAAVDIMTESPTEAMIDAGTIELQDGHTSRYDPTGFYRTMTLRVWESMVRTMKEERN